MKNGLTRRQQRRKRPVRCMVSVALAAALALNPLSPLAPYGGVTAEAATYPGWPDNGVFQTSVPEEFNSAKLMNKMSETRLDSNDGWGLAVCFH